MMGGRILLKKGVVPHLFHCQDDIEFSNLNVCSKSEEFVEDDLTESVEIEVDESLPIKFEHLPSAVIAEHNEVEMFTKANESFNFLDDVLENTGFYETLKHSVPVEGNDECVQTYHLLYYIRYMHTQQYRQVYLT